MSSPFTTRHGIEPAGQRKGKSRLTCTCVLTPLFSIQVFQLYHVLCKSFSFITFCGERASGTEDKSGIKQHLSWVLVNYWRNFTKLIYWWDAMKQGALAFQTEGSCGSYPLSQSTISFFEGKRNPWLQPASNLGWYQLATWLKPDPIRFNHVESG